MKHTDAVPVALITGCSSGIGRATARYLAERGWRVYATARRPESVAGLASETITPLALDVTLEASCAAAVDHVSRQAGRMDALINNAGYGVFGPLEDIPLQEARAQFETNVFGALRLCQLVIPAMRRQREGRIVNVSSIAGRIVAPSSGVYSASKFALEALSDALRVELRPWNIKVVLIEPGSVNTHFADAAAGRARRISSEASPYAASLKNFEYYQGAYTPAAPGPEVVAKVIYKALTARHPAPRYVGTPGIGWTVLLALLPFLPIRLTDALKARAFGFK